MLRTVGLLLEELGFEGQRAAIELASAEALEARECTPDAGGSLSTREAGEAVLRRLRENLGASGALW
jgi:isocitrate/isopropylmalate dehydrogenase